MPNVIIVLFLIFFLQACAKKETRLTPEKLKSVFTVDYKDGSSVLYFHLAKESSDRSSIIETGTDVYFNSQKLGTLSASANNMFAVITKKRDVFIEWKSADVIGSTRSVNLTIPASSKLMVDETKSDVMDPDHSVRLKAFDAKALNAARLFDVFDLR